MDSMGTAGFGLQVAGMAAGVVGSFYSAKSQKLALESQAQIAEINARIAELGAQSTLIQGQRQVGQISQRAGAVKSAQRASMAANGVDLGEGSAAEVLASTDILKEQDMQTAHSNALSAAWGYRTQGMNSTNEAATKRATSGAINPGMQAASTLLGSAGSVAQSWYAMKKGAA
jgi:hypothetical protein